jgi:hypothetical protein
MKAIYAVARREIIEKKFIFPAALAVSVMPLLIPVLRGMAGGSARDLREFLAVFAAWSFAAAVSAGLGASVLAGEIARGRGGFYFSRPLSSVSIWLGKLAGSIGLAVAAGLLVLIPTLVADRRLDPLVDLAGSTQLGLLLAAAGAVLVFLASHAIATMLRSRSSLALADLVLAGVVGFLSWDALHRLHEIWPNPDNFLWRVGAAASLIVAAVLLAGMHRGVERGRTDPRAAHRALSVTIWSGLLVATLGTAVYSRWVLAATATELDSIDYATPFGSEGWVELDGVARGARARFLYDTRAGRSRRMSGPAVVSADGLTAVWAHRDSRTDPWVVHTIRLDSSSASPHETKLTLRDTRRMFVSADGSRLGSIEGGLLSVAELASGRSLASVRIGKPSRFAEAVFIGRDLVRIYATASDDEGPLEIMELDLRKPGLRHTGRADSARAWYWGTPAHDRFVDTDEERRVWTLRDGGSGSMIATLRQGESLASGRPVALADGRWALLLADARGSWVEVFSPTGEKLSRIAIGPGDSPLRPGGEVAPGKLAVAAVTTGGRRADYTLYVVDLDRGTTVRSATGLRPLFLFQPTVRPGSEATKLYLDDSNGLVRFDPVTGDRRVLIAVSDPG